MFPSRSIQLAICLSLFCVFTARGSTLREDEFQLLSFYVEAPNGGSLRATRGTCASKAVDARAFPEVDITSGMRYLIELKVKTGDQCEIVWDFKSGGAVKTITQELVVSGATLSGGITFTNLCTDGICCKKGWRDIHQHTCPMKSCEIPSAITGRQPDTFTKLCGADDATPIVLVGSRETLCTIPKVAIVESGAENVDDRPDQQVVETVDKIMKYEKTPFVDMLVTGLKETYNFQWRNEDEYSKFQNKLYEELEKRGDNAETRHALTDLVKEKERELARPDSEWYEHIPKMVSNKESNIVTDSFFATLCSNDINQESMQDQYEDMQPKNAYINMGADGDTRPVYFQTKLFAGRVKLRLRSVNEAPGAKDLNWQVSTIFKSAQARKEEREFDLQIEGYFKENVNMMDPVFGMGLRGWDYKDADVSIPWTAKRVDSCSHKTLKDGHVYVTGSNFPCSLKAMFDTGVDINEEEAAEPGLALRKLYSSPNWDKMYQDGMSDVSGENRFPLKDGTMLCDVDSSSGTFKDGMCQAKENKVADYEWPPRHAFFKKLFGKESSYQFKKNRIYAFNTWANQRMRLDAFALKIPLMGKNFHDVLEENNKSETRSELLRPYRAEGSLDSDPSKVVFCVAVYNMNPSRPRSQLEN